MTRKTTNILLLISLVFNLAVISMFTITFIRMREMRPRLRSGEKFPSEKVRNHLKEMKPIHQDYSEAKQAFFKVLRSDELDLEKAEKMLEITVQKQIVMEQKLGERLIELRKELSAEEFRKLASRQRFEPRPPGPNERPRKNRMKPKGEM